MHDLLTVGWLAIFKVPGHAMHITTLPNCNRYHLACCSLGVHSQCTLSFNPSH